MDLAHEAALKLSLGQHVAARELAEAALTNDSNNVLALTVFGEAVDVECLPLAPENTLFLRKALTTEATNTLKVQRVAEVEIYLRIERVFFKARGSNLCFS